MGTILLIILILLLVGALPTLLLILTAPVVERDLAQSADLGWLVA